MSLQDLTIEEVWENFLQGNKEFLHSSAYKGELTTRDDLRKFYLCLDNVQKLYNELQIRRAKGEALISGKILLPDS